MASPTESVDSSAPNRPPSSAEGSRRLAPERAARLIDWLEHVAHRNQIRWAVRFLAEQYLGSGDSPIYVTKKQLIEAIRQGEGGPTSSPPRFDTSTLETWWSSNTVAIGEIGAEDGLQIRLEVLRSAGGAKNPARYGLFEIAVDVERDDGFDVEVVPDSPPNNAVSYNRVQETPGWLLRLWLGPSGVRQVRGYFQAALVLFAPFVVCTAMASVAFFAVRADMPAGSVWTAFALLCGLQGIVHLRLVAHLLRWRSVALGDMWLRLEQDAGQLLLERDRVSKGARISNVRFTATCPRCASEVAVHSGRSTYPDRLIGRCSASPREHVYSFDPLTCRGAPLID